jgi:hypothetical protein
MLCKTFRFVIFPEQGDGLITGGNFCTHYDSVFK